MTMTPDVDIETLRLLVAVEDAGSVTAAARAVGISQPAATSRIKAFEARWRLAVIKRSPRGSTMTTDGRAVVSWARAVLHATDQMRAGLAALSSDRAAEVSVAASLTVAEFILPRWLGKLHAVMPEVQPRLHVVTATGSRSWSATARSTSGSSRPPRGRSTSPSASSDRTGSSWWWRRGTRGPGTATRSGRRRC